MVRVRAKGRWAFEVELPETRLAGDPSDGQAPVWPELASSLLVRL